MLVREHLKKMRGFIGSRRPVAQPGMQTDSELSDWEPEDSASAQGEPPVSESQAFAAVIEEMRRDMANLERVRRDEERAGEELRRQEIQEQREAAH